MRSSQDSKPSRSTPWQTLSSLHGLSMKADDKLESYIDEAFFLGGVSKRDVLSAFGAHIFFDDKHVHADPASEVVPSAVVQYREGDNPEK